MIELETDKKQVFGLMLGQISETSKATIRETEPGLAAITAVVVPGIPGLRAVPDLVTIHPILPPTVHIHP